MPFEYHISPDTGLVATVAWGTVTDQHLLGHVAAMAADDALPRAMREFVSLEAVTDPRISADTVWRIAERDRHHIPYRYDSYAMTVVAPTDVAYGLTRMYQMMIGEVVPTFSVHRSYEAAREDLALTESEIRFVRCCIERALTRMGAD